MLPWAVSDSPRKQPIDTEPGKESLLKIAKDYLGEDNQDFALFYTFFWSFDLPDIKVPTELYETRIAEHKKLATKAEEPKLHLDFVSKLEAELITQQENHKHCMYILKLHMNEKY